MSKHTAQTKLKLLGKLILTGELTCQTGLHIGAGKGSLEIGGADNPVVKDAFGVPYVPGSSLRGRLRSLLEGSMGLTAPGEMIYLSRRRGQQVRIHQSNRPGDEVGLLFGRMPGRMERVEGDALEAKAVTPARLAIYDAPLDAGSISSQMRENMDDELTEVKSENAIDRITAQANPRTLERVPAGAKFRVRMVLDILCEEDRVLMSRLVEGLRLLEDDALGGGGSRGSGQVSLGSLTLAWRDRTYYSSGNDEAVLVSDADLSSLQKLVNDAGFGEKLGLGASSSEETAEEAAPAEESSEEEPSEESGPESSEDAAEEASVETSDDGSAEEASAAGDEAPGDDTAGEESKEG